MNHPSSLLSANPDSPFLHFTLDSSCAKQLIALPAARHFMCVCLLFFLILQASAQMSIIVKTFSPPPERDSALIAVTPHYFVLLSDLSIRVYSQQQIPMMCQGLDKRLGTQRRFRHHPVLTDSPFNGTMSYLFLRNCLSHQLHDMPWMSPVL